jgi:hypothetical protein
MATAVAAGVHNAKQFMIRARLTIARPAAFRKRLFRKRLLCAVIFT